VGMVSILYDPAGSGSIPPGVQVLQGGEGSANCALSRTHHPLQSPPVLRGAVAEPGSDAAHPLHSSPINPQWCLSALMLCPPRVVSPAPYCVQGEGSGGVFAHPEDMGPGD